MAINKPVLYEGETVLYSSGIWTYRNAAANSIGTGQQMWLTNQRLILKAGMLAYQVTFPLYRMTNVWEGKEIHYPFSSDVCHLLCLEFDNGRREWMVVGNQSEQAQFLSALNSARTQAPPVPDPVIAPDLAQSGKLPRKVIVVLGGFIVFTFFFIILIALACTGIMSFITSPANLR